MRCRAALPSDLPASVTVLLHVLPDGESLLPEVLRRISPLGVEVPGASSSPPLAGIC
jgi:hypothetical protein